MQETKEKKGKKKSEKKRKKRERRERSDHLGGGVYKERSSPRSNLKQITTIDSITYITP